MALELKTDDDSTTITDADLMPDGDKETSYTIRHLTTAKHREIVKAHTKKVPNKHTHQREDVTDWEAVSDDLIDYVLTGWHNVIASGQQVACTLANKLLLDGPRKKAILELAGMNEIAAAPERRAESFRQIERVG